MTIRDSGSLPRVSTLVMLLCCLFVFVLPWANLVVLPFLGTGTRIVGIVLSGLWLVSVLVNDRIRDFGSVHRATYALTAWMGISIFWAADLLSGALRLSQFLQVFLLFIIIWNVFRGFYDVVWLQQSFVLGCWVAFTILSYNVLTGQVTQWERRATISNFNENELGLFLALSMPIGWHLASSKQPEIARRVGKLKLFNYLYVPAGLIGIMFTASRGSFLAASPFLLFLVYSIRHYSPMRRVVAAVAVAGMAFVAVLLSPDSAWERIFTIRESVEDKDLGSRYGIWADAYDTLREGLPGFFFGQGLNSFEPVVGKDAHNIILSLTVEIGLLGLVLFGAVFFGVVNRARSLPAAERALALTVLAIFSIASMAYSSEGEKVTWVLFSMITAQAGAHDFPSRRRDGPNRAQDDSGHTENCPDVPADSMLVGADTVPATLAVAPGQRTMLSPRDGADHRTPVMDVEVGPLNGDVSRGLG